MSFFLIFKIYILFVRLLMCMHIKIIYLAIIHVENRFNDTIPWIMAQVFTVPNTLSFNDA